MLALQLHKAPRPNLNAGAFFVPIMRWREDGWRDGGAEYNWRRQLQFLEHAFGRSDQAHGSESESWPPVGGHWQSFEFQGHARAYLNWKRTLEVKGGRSYYRNTKIRFMTLVRVPDAHRVFLARDWTDKGGGITGRALRDLEPALKADVNACSDLPELIILERLPLRHRLWTKDLRLIQRSGSLGHADRAKDRAGRRGAWGSEWA